MNDSTINRYGFVFVKTVKLIKIGIVSINSASLILRSKLPQESFKTFGSLKLLLRTMSFVFSEPTSRSNGIEEREFAILSLFQWPHRINSISRYWLLLIFAMIASKLRHSYWLGSRGLHEPVYPWHLHFGHSEVAQLFGI